MPEGSIDPWPGPGDSFSVMGTDLGPTSKAVPLAPERSYGKLGQPYSLLPKCPLLLPLLDPGLRTNLRDPRDGPGWAPDCLG